MTRASAPGGREAALAQGYRAGEADYYNPGGEYRAPAVLKPDDTPVQLYASTGLRALTLDEQWAIAEAQAQREDGEHE